MAYSLRKRPSTSHSAWVYVFTMSIDCRSRNYSNEHGFRLTPLLSDDRYAYQCDAIERVDDTESPDWSVLMKLQDNVIDQCAELASVYDYVHMITTRPAKTKRVADAEDNREADVAHDDEDLMYTAHKSGIWFFKFEMYKYWLLECADHVSFEVKPVPFYATTDVRDQHRAIRKLKDTYMDVRKADCIENIVDALGKILKLYDREFRRLLPTE